MWNSGIFAQDNEEYETDAVTGALIACCPEIATNEEALRRNVMKFVSQENEALADVSRLYNIDITKLDRHRREANLKMAVMAVAASMSLLAMGVAIGRFVWRGSHPVESGIELGEGSTLLTL